MPVKAWIASGDYAVGLLFASGNFAIAPVSMGASAIGLVSFGGCAVGLLSLGGFSFGVWSFGALAFGWQVFGACAIAWNAANGGIAIAHGFAVGSIAHAWQANNGAARFLFSAQPVFPASTAAPALFGLAESALGHSHVCPVASRSSRPWPAEREKLAKTKYALSDRTDGFEADYDRCDSKPGAGKRAVAVRARRVRRGMVLHSIGRTPATRTPFGAVSR